MQDLDTDSIKVGGVRIPQWHAGDVGPGVIRMPYEFVIFSGNVKYEGLQDSCRFGAPRTIHALGPDLSPDSVAANFPDRIALNVVMSPSSFHQRRPLNQND